MCDDWYKVQGDQPPWHQSVVQRLKGASLYYTCNISPGEGVCDCVCARACVCKRERESVCVECMSVMDPKIHAVKSEIKTNFLALIPLCVYIIEYA